MLDIDMQFKNGILVTRLKGYLTTDTISYFNNHFLNIIKRNKVKYVLLNLNFVYLIDNLGFEKIKEGYKILKENNGKLMLCGINKIFDYNNSLNENLYQISEEQQAYEIVKI